MNSLIDHIHNTLDMPLPPNSEHHAKIIARLDPLMDQITSHFGLSFANDLTDLQGELNAGYEDREFRLGFITGAKLMMEVLG